MKITKSLISHFEQEQTEFGTETAIFNLLWSLASEQLKAIGVNSIKTSLCVNGCDGEKMGCSVCPK